MKKPIIFSVLFFIITAISSFGQGRWLEENIDPVTGLRTGLIEVNGKLYDIRHRSWVLIDGNLSGADLSKADLREADLTGANLIGADLSGANLEEANLEEANLKNAKLRGVKLQGANFRGATLEGASFISTFEDPEWGNPNFRRQSLNNEISLNEQVLALMDSGNWNYNKIKILETKVEANNAKIGITPEQADAITVNATNTVRNTSEIEELKPTLEALGQNDTAIGEQLTALGQNDISIGEQMTKLGENDQSIMVEINAMKAQLQTLVASVAEKDAQIAEKDAKIAELEQGGGGQSLEQVLEQVRDARAGSVVLTVGPEGDTVTLGLTIEQSDNLTEWTKLDGEMTRTIPIPDGKKFYRFALDK